MARKSGHEKHREKSESLPLVKKSRKRTSKHTHAPEPKNKSKIKNKAQRLIDEAEGTGGRNTDIVGGKTVSDRKSAGRAVQFKSPIKKEAPLAPKQKTRSKIRAGSPVEVPAEKAQEVKKSVSAAGIFKKRRVKDDSKKHRKHKNSSPEKLNLSDEFSSYIEEARQTIDTNMLQSFEHAQVELSGKLKAIRVSDEAFFERLAESTKDLAMPLAEEEISTTFTRDGHEITETVNMGVQIENFKASIEKEKIRLHELWQAWENLQNEYVELGLDVFGAEAFGAELDYIQGKRGSGYRWEMELLEVEHITKIEEVTARIESMRDIALQKIVATEKEMNARVNRDNARVFRAFLDEQ